MHAITKHEASLGIKVVDLNLKEGGIEGEGEPSGDQKLEESLLWTSVLRGGLPPLFSRAHVQRDNL